MTDVEEKKTICDYVDVMLTLRFYYYYYIIIEQQRKILSP